MKKFNPLNELEWSLLAAQENKISVEIFLQKFVRSVLVLPAAKNVLEDGSGFEPVLFDKLGTNMLAAFADKTRASHLADIARYCLEMNGLEVLRRIPPGYGLVVNPGFGVGLELSPEGIAEIVKDMG